MPAQHVQPGPRFGTSIERDPSAAKDVIAGGDMSLTLLE
jgi:hypothetical protein